MSNPCATHSQSCESSRPQCECQYQPNVDIIEEAGEIVMLADLPGASPDSIEVDYEGGELSITARVESRQDPNTAFLIREYGTGDYHRKFRVSEIVDVERIEATYTNGVLTVHLPKVEAAKPRRVSISSN